MKRDAHYYAILAFCRTCGFSKKSAQIIAYASQLVDDAKINLIFFNPSNSIIEYDLVNNRPAFFNMATCHSYFRVKTFNYEAMVNNTVAFHFVPGCKGENFTKKLRCRAESPIIMAILKDVLLEDNLIKLGIVLHVYADTFSHQGFSGMLSKVNDIKNCEASNKKPLGLLDRTLKIFKQLGQEKYENYFDHIMPAYGHGQALDYPDLPYLVWSYEYDFSDEFNGSYKKVVIDNKDRYQGAFMGIRNYLETYLTNHQQYVDQKLKFKNFDTLRNALVLEAHDKNREKNWQRVLVEQGLVSKDDQDLLIYEDDQWLKEAFYNYDRKVFDNREVDGVQLADNFVTSNWYGFYLAVKWYKKKFFHYCEKYQLNIPN
ncbi:DUF6765 family protein [Desulfitobacterium sp.]|uniref:DUF6765 family protein n=1 Tax=Desulfitobacterium sp. TaxID=49981 RepID=UPI002B736D95|nr:DUF6765 family protein [Desulfitobacterium sp.]HVJ48839.1 DUF6765 family protein [Desulfitobacterium sp.]